MPFDQPLPSLFKTLESSLFKGVLGRTDKTGDSNMPFRFFDLPCELREQIYDAVRPAVVPEWTAPKPSPLDAITVPPRTGPHSSLLRVSKQFSAEYRNRQNYEEPRLVLDAGETPFEIYAYFWPRRAEVAIREFGTYSLPLAAPKTLRSITLVVRPHSLDSQFHDDLCDAVKSMHSHMPQITAFVIELTRPLMYVKMEVEADCIKVQDLFSSASRLAELSSPDFTIDYRVLLEAQLCGGMRLYASDEWVCEDEFRIDDMCFDGENTIVYEATLSSDPEAHLGLDLATVSAGYETVEDVVESLGGMLFS